jgi:hypothetical protein
MTDEEDGAARLNVLHNLSQSLGLFRSCIFRANTPNLRTRGCITHNPATKNHFNACLKYKTKLHVTKGCGQLYPSEVRKIRNHLLSRGDPVSSQMWVMILLGIRKFLRSDELITLTMEDFINSHHPKGKLYPVLTNGIGALTKCQVLHLDSVRSVASEVQGKQDDQPVRLVLHIDKEYPEFCPVRHLLWYLKVFNIKSGYLFSPADVLIAGY